MDIGGQKKISHQVRGDFTCALAGWVFFSVYIFPNPAGWLWWDCYGWCWAAARCCLLLFSLGIISVAKNTTRLFCWKYMACLLLIASPCLLLLLRPRKSNNELLREAGEKSPVRPQKTLIWYSRTDLPTQFANQSQFTTSLYKMFMRPFKSIQEKNLRNFWKITKMMTQSLIQF